MGLQERGELHDPLLVHGTLTHELVAQPPRQAPGRGFLSEEQLEQLADVEVAFAPQDRLRPGVVPGRDEPHLASRHRPPGQRPRGFLCVSLCVTCVDTEREQLHDLAREVLVTRALHIVLAVQPVDHCRVFANFGQ